MGASFAKYYYTRTLTEEDNGDRIFGDISIGSETKTTRSTGNIGETEFGVGGHR
jgi:hypothetical protein